MAGRYLNHEIAAGISSAEQDVAIRQISRRCAGQPSVFEVAICDLITRGVERFREPCRFRRPSFVVVGKGGNIGNTELPRRRLERTAR